MKLNKTIGALALGLSAVTIAQAGPDAGYTPIYITGSTAFRGQVFQALNVDMGLPAQQGGTSGANSFTLEGTESDPHTLGLANVGTKFEVFCNFSGSAEGCGAVLGVAPYNTASYFNSTATTGTFSHTGVDFAFSDVDQNSTPYPWNTGAYPQLTEDQDPNAGYPYTGVAVITFTFAANKSAITAGISNISAGTSAQDFIAMFQSAPGYRDQSFFTGVAAGTTPSVVAVGRYPLSGTRIATVLDDGGTTANPLYQFALGDVNAAYSATNPPTVNNGDSTPLPNAANAGWMYITNSGYFTGGNVGAALNASGADGLSPAIGYIGWPDAQGKFSGGNAAPISWNGQQAFVGAFPTSAGGHWNLAGIENGSYQLWSYERLYENSSDVGTSYDSYGQDIILALEHEITAASPQTAVLESQMNVYRNQDGGQVLSFVTPEAP